MFLRFIQSNNLRALIFFALLFFLPTQFGKHFWPPFSLLEGIRVDYLSPTLYVTDILACAFIILSVSFIRIPRVLFVVLLFCAIGIFFSLSPLAGWYTFAKFVEYLLLGFAIAIWFSKETFGIPAGLALGSAVIYETALAFLQFIHQGSLGGLLYFMGERTFSSDTPGIANASIAGQLILRPYGTLPHPNVLAGFLLIAMLMCFAFLAKANKKLQIFLWVVLGVGAFGIFLSFSRSAIFMLLVSAVIVGFKKLKTKKRMLVIASGILIGVLILLGIFFPLLWERFSLSFSDESIVQRQQLFDISLKMIRTHPVFGVGFGNFSTNALQNSFGKGSIFLLQPVHNIFLFIASEGGLVSLLFCIWFLYTTIRRVFSIHTTETSGYPFVLLVCLFVIIGIGQTDHYFVTLQQGQLLTTLILGLSWNAIPRSSANP